MSYPISPDICLTIGENVDYKLFWMYIFSIQQEIFLSLKLITHSNFFFRNGKGLQMLEAIG